MVTGDGDVLLAVDSARSLAGVSAHGSPSRKKEVLAGRDGKAVRHWRAGGAALEIQEEAFLLCAGFACVG